MYAAGVGAVLALAGCSGFKAPIFPLFQREAPPTSPAVVVVEGDADDVDSAVYAASMAAQTVDIALDTPGPGRWEYSLLTVDGSPGTLSVVQRADGLIEMTCRIGRFGDAEREQHYVAAIAARLEELHGVDYAKIKDRTPPPPALLPPMTPRLPAVRR
jgi:hypothetical protein